MDEDAQADPIVPDEAGRLSVSLLAARRQYTALAALATLAPAGQAPATEAMSALAAAASEPVPFQWWWRIARHSTDNLITWAASIEELASPVHVPADMEAELEDFLLGDPTTAPSGRMTPEDRLRIALFAHLDQASTLARRVAGTTVTKTSARDEMRQSSFVILGKSTQDEDRAYVLNSALADGAIDLQRLKLLVGPIRDHELDDIAAGLSKHLRAPGADRLEDASILLSRLPRAKLADILLERFDMTHRLAEDGLGHHLRGPGIRELLEEIDRRDAVPEAVVNDIRAALLGSTPRLSEDDAQDLAVWAAVAYGHESITAHAAALAQRVESHWDPPGAARARKHMLELLIVAPGTPAERALAEIVLLGDIDLATIEGAQPAALWSIGRALAMAVAASRPALTPEALEDHLTSLLEADPGNAAKLVVGGALSVSPRPPESLISALSMSTVGVCALVRAELSEPAADALRARHAEASDIAAAVVALSDTATNSDEILDRFVPLIEPSTLTRADANELSVALAGRAALGLLARQLVTSLLGPEAEHVGPAALAVVLQAAAESGQMSAHPLDEALAHAAHTAAYLPDGAVQAAVAGWLAAAPLSAATLGVVVEAAEAHTRPNNPFTSARKTLAARYVDGAKDVTTPAAERVTHLEHAVRADGSTARTAAFDLSSNTNVTLRRAAARALADTPGTSDDVERLEQLVANEGDRDARTGFERALRHIHSGDVGEALRNLTLLLDTEPVDPAHWQTYQPYPLWDRTFLECTDELRNATTGPSAGVVTAAIKLGELLVNLAIGALWADKDTKKHKDSTALLENHAGKPDVGVLVNRQDLLQELPWLHTYAALRNYRSVHPSPAGSTEPAPVPTSADVPLELAAGVFEGYLKTMASLRRPRTP